jgi:peptidoglycan-N-acetylglucosamine deacetylase
MIRSAGFVGLRTVELLSIDAPRLTQGLMLLPTTIQAHPHQRSTYARNMGRRLGIRNLFLYIASGCHTNWAELAISLAELVSVRGGVFHLWGHSWEIERTGQWNQLEHVLKIISSMQEKTLRLSNSELAIHLLPAPKEPV